MIIHNFHKNFFKDKVIYVLDGLLILLVVGVLVYDVYSIFHSLLERVVDWSTLNNQVSWMNSNTPSGQASSGSVTTQIIHSDNGVKNTIISLFIYGTGGWRLWVARSGTPGTRFMETGGTIIADSVSRIKGNAINDPTYLRSQASNTSSIYYENKTIPLVVPIPGISLHSEVVAEELRQRGALAVS